MVLLLHGLIFIGLTWVTPLGGVIWVVAVCVFRLVRRGIRRIVVLCLLLLIALTMIWATRPVAAHQTSNPALFAPVPDQ